MKPRISGQGVVANPRDTTRYRCGLRLALTRNTQFHLYRYLRDRTLEEGRDLVGHVVGPLLREEVAAFERAPLHSTRALRAPHGERLEQGLYDAALAPQHEHVAH